MMPLVSILIPAYNAEESIADTIESALAQTWSRKEIIIVDDGSTDQTLSVAKKFAAKGVSVVSQVNQGAAATRNRLIALSQGSYIQWLDADDLLSKDKVASQLAAASSNGSSERTLFSSGWGYFYYRTAKADFRPSPLWCDLTPMEWLLRKMEHNLHMQTATWLVSRALTEAAGPWDCRLMGDDDGEYFSRVILKSDAIKFVTGGQVYYRRSGYGRLSYIGNSDRRMEAQCISMKLNVAYVRSLDDGPRTRAACLKYLQCWVSGFYPNRHDLIQQVEQLAESVGGRLQQPRLPWKYAWIERLFSRKLANHVQILLPRLKWSFVRIWDKAMFRCARTKAIS
jgi:glycosyltransferase involved in cell wall biosynthesis